MQKYDCGGKHQLHPVSPGWKWSDDEFLTTLSVTWVCPCGHFFCVDSTRRTEDIKIEVP